MDWDDLVDEVLEYFEMRTEEFNDALEELDANFGWLDTGRYEPMDYLDDYCSEWSATQIIDKVASDFDTSANYFYDDWGTLYSANERDYSEQLNKDFIEALYEHWASYQNWYNLPKFVEDLFTKYYMDNGSSAG
jgi:hypothetical protein